MTPFRDLREYIAELDRNKFIQTIEGADWNLEIGALTEMVAFSRRPRALLFDGIKGYPKGFRVATNLYVNPELQALALGLPPGTGVEQVRRWRQKLSGLQDLAPRFVQTGPVQENRMSGPDVDITAFPAPLWHERDGGRYFGTGDVVVTYDPEEQWVNAAPYRCQILDSKTLGLMIVPGHHGYGMLQKYWKRQQDAPVVVVEGVDPHLYAAACSPLPEGRSEIDFAGGLRGEPVDVILEPKTGLPIPAAAEIAVIGRVPPPEKETRQEGPFGECMGYYSAQGPSLVIHIDEIWHRRDPILQGNPTMHGSSMLHALGAQWSTGAAIWEVVDKQVPHIAGVYPLFQTCQSGAQWTVIAIRQSYPGHAKHAAVAALGAHAGIHGNKAIVVVDEDVDPSNMDEVLFAIATRCDPAEDIDIIRGIPSFSLDPRIPPERRQKGDFTTSTVIVNACRPYAWKDQFAALNTLSAELRDRFRAKWGETLG